MSYDLSNVEDLIAFDKECQATVNTCPQANVMRHIEIGKTVSIAGTFKYWYSNSTLWASQWFVVLPDKARETFERYALFKDGRVIDSKTNVIYSPDDRFVIKERYERHNSVR